MTKNDFPMESSNILLKDEEIKILSKLYKKKDKFKVYDIEIKEVGIVKSYGSQYKQILQDKKVDELLKKMREKFQNKKII